jgi:isoquinoline 1-oxidoreductase subunit alpha
MLKFIVNGKTVKYKGNQEMPLLWVLRDILGFTGTKFGCGAGLCGACTVHVDGQAQRSCITPVKTVNNRVITTIEGLSEDGSHPVQQAWNELDVPQCGYCQAGQIMSVADLLSRIPNPTDDEINSQHTNICRCGSYPRIRKAIHRAAVIAAKED